MKANAPEKIYIPITEGQEIAINEWGSIPLSQYEHKRVVENIEYTRTDAFIEKADKFISSFFHPDDTELKKCILDEFHKYMKGE